MPQSSTPIYLEALQRDGYQEDKHSIRRFERRYAPFSIPGVLGFFFGLYLAFTGHEREGLIIAGVSFLVTMAATIHARVSIPTSAISGQPMEKYRRLGGPDSETEFIYVDHSSRTFCRRIVGSRD
jgi:hypothetical protein